MFRFSTMQPIIQIWCGEFVNDAGNNWQHRKMQNDHDFELIIARSGSFGLIANGRHFSLKSGDCILLPPFSKIVGDTPSNQAFKLDWLHFLANGQKVQPNSVEYIRGLQDIIAGNQPTVINEYVYLPENFSISNRPHIYQLFKQLLNLSVRKSYTERGHDFMTSLFLTELANDFLTAQALKAKSSPSNVEFIAEWIRVHLADQLTVGMVAAHFELNPAYLSRKFHREYGVGVKSYILAQKVNHAQYLLSTTIDPVNIVAERSFFENPKNFMRVFKQHTGITPSQYRELYTGTRLNSTSVDPKSPIPDELGTKALHRVLNQILREEKD